MTESHFVNALQAFSRRRPFKFYMIELHSGTRLKITHPEAIQIRSGVAYHVSPGEGSGTYLFDHDSVSMICDDEE